MNRLKTLLHTHTRKIKKVDKKGLVKKKRKTEIPKRKGNKENENKNNFALSPLNNNNR